MPGVPPDYAELKPLLLDTLFAQQTDLSEHSLLRTLSKTLQYFEISGLETLELFQRHFLLFHYLYRLQQDLWQQQLGHLQISALAIRLLPYQPGQSDQIDLLDPLQDYYLDLGNMAATQQNELDEMLGGFWTRIANRDNRSEALAILGLADPIDDSAIRQRYRELVMTHHPDRGGDTARLQILNAAMAELSPKRRY